MSEAVKETLVEILGKSYPIKCPEGEITFLQKAAELLEQRMRAMRKSSNALSLDQIAVVTSLNLVHQLTTLELQKNAEIQSINKRLHDLQDKLANAMAFVG